ncbi:MAG: recombinase family protein, partial [Oscillospiraceae bacterium]
MKGLKENAYSGKHTGGMPPLGYRVNPETTRIEIDENEAEAVRLIFQMADEGNKYPAILGELKARGFRIKTGREFTSTGIHDILKNQKYIGICIYNRRVSQSVANNSRRFKDESEWIISDDVYPPLVRREQFNRIQEKMKNRSVSGQAHPKEVYLLSGKIHCGLFGRAYCGERKINGKGIVSYSYFCNSRNHAKDEHCRNPQVNRSYIGSYVLGKLAEYVFTDGMIPRIMEDYNRYLENRVGSSAKRLEQCKNSLREVELKINKTVDLLIDVGSAALKNRLSELEKQKAGLEKDISTLVGLLAANRVTEKELKCVFAEIRGALTAGTLANAKQLVDTYIHDVVYPDRIVVIFNLFPHIKFPDKQTAKANEEL